MAFFQYAWRLLAAVLFLIVFFVVTNPMICAAEGGGYNTECNPIRIDMFLVIPLAMWFALARARKAAARGREIDDRQ
ncbi:MAG TPA: hypothetical protein VM600_04170 [Actinomycetota bacterium]|nr:hypothetical protein [Actinomycetota bacterium]